MTSNALPSEAPRDGGHEACCRACSEGSRCDSSATPAVLVPVAEPPDVIRSECGCDDLSQTVHFRLEPGVPQKVAWRLALVAGAQLEEVSQAYELGACNAVLFQFAVLNRSGGFGAAGIEGSLDKCFWESTGVTVQLNSIGRFKMAFSPLTWRFVRLRYSAVVSPLNAVLSATIVGTCDVP